MKIDLPDADINYIASFYSLARADKIFQQLAHNIMWRQDDITMFGRTVNIPRLQAWFSDNNLTYRYSNMTLDSTPFPPMLSDIRDSVSDYCRDHFNAVLANFYRDQCDSVGWHSDDESELGTNPVIASLSFGAEREFQLKHIQTKEKFSIRLAPGSLFIMKGQTQHYWQHCIPKRSKSIGPRINLTFRKICS